MLFKDARTGIERGTLRLSERASHFEWETGKHARPTAGERGCLSVRAQTFHSSVVKLFLFPQ